MLLAFECGRCCLSHTGSKEQPLESKVDSCPLQEKQTDTNSSHSPSPGGSKTSYKGAVPHCFSLFPIPWTLSPSPRQCPLEHPLRWVTSRGAERKHLPSWWPKHGRDFLRELGDLQGQIKWKKENRALRRIKNVAQNSREGCGAATLLLHFLPFFFCLFWNSNTTGSTLRAVCPSWFPSLVIVWQPIFKGDINIFPEYHPSIHPSQHHR